jgi:hypothetical protein
VHLRVVAALLAVLAMPAFAACQSNGSNSSTGSSSTTTAHSTTTSTAAPSCALGPGYTVGTTTHTLPVAGVERELLVHLPPKPAANMPLVVDFHGAGSNMAQQAVYSGFDAVADKNGFVVATPNGVDAPIRQWNFLGQDDVAFAKAIIDELVAHARRHETCACGRYLERRDVGVARAPSVDRFAGFGLVAGDFTTRRSAATLNAGRSSSSTGRATRWCRTAAAAWRPAARRCRVPKRSPGPGRSTTVAPGPKETQLEPRSCAWTGPAARSRFASSPRCSLSSPCSRSRPVRVTTRSRRPDHAPGECDRRDVEAVQSERLTRRTSGL